MHARRQEHGILCQIDVLPRLAPLIHEIAKPLDVEANLHLADAVTMRNWLHQSV